ncbi:MAG: DEAD/DEAH box helicase [Nanoarchaeota archaeon]
MEFKNLKLDKFQEDAINAIERNNSVIVSAPTGSGKTLIADFIIDRELKGENRVIYTAPIKALSNQKYKDFCDDYGKDNIGLVTGDVVINPTGQVLIMTTEVYRNMAIISDPVLDNVSYVIMDEIHYLGDTQRGHIWEESIIFSEDVKFLFLSATIPNAEEFANWVRKIKEHSVEVIEYHHRPVPLDIKFYKTESGINTLENIKELDSYPRIRQRQKGKRKKPLPFEYKELINELRAEWLPAIYFVFSRLKTQEFALNFARTEQFLTGNEKKEVGTLVAEEFRKLSIEVTSLKSTGILRKCLLKGIGFHHAGIVPDLKHIVEKLFARGLIKVLFATETFALGINMPAKSVCFDSLRKFTNEGFRYLNSKEFFQIAGRAGRRGIDDKGLAVSVVRRGDELDKIASFTKEDKMPIKSQFRLSYNTILNMYNIHNGDEIEKILKMNFYTYQELDGRIDDIQMLNSIRARYSKAIKVLKKKGYIEGPVLTEKGKFATKIFSNELEISEVYFNMKLDAYSLLLILAALVYEDKRGRFYKKYIDKDIYRLKDRLKTIFPGAGWVNNVPTMTAIIRPCMEGKTFIDILKNTSLLEGDLIRILMQVLDRLEQINKASEDELVLKCKEIIRGPLEGISVF